MQRLKSSAWRGPILAGILALLVTSAILWHQQLTPFGNRNLLISDMGTQYLSFFTAYRQALLTHNWQLYSFSQSLGGSVVPTMAYYLMSPFNLLLLLFPAANLPTGITVLLMVKVSAIAITMTIFLQRHFQTQRLSAAIFGLAFSLCGFVAMNYFDLMWLDALIWLPLVLDGVDHLLRTTHSGRFFGWLWVSIVTDFYLGYMTCLFVIYYFIYMWFETKTPEQSFLTDLKQRRALLGKTIRTAILSAASTLFLLLPTALGMLQTAKSTHAVSSFLPVPQFGFDVLSQLGVGANTYADRLVHAPTLFSTTAVVLLGLGYFVHPKISRAHKWHASILLIAMLLSMEIRFLDTVWHLFQQPEGFPFREAFFFSFVLIMLAFATWQAQPQRLARHWQWGLPVILIGLLVIGAGTNQWLGHVIHPRVLTLSLGYVIITALALFATQRTLRTCLIAGLVATELGANSVLSMRTTHFGNQTKYATAYRTEARQMRAVSEPAGQLYRVTNANTLINQAYREKYNNYNDPLLFNFHGVNAYSSTLNQQTWLTLKAFGLFGENARRISSEGLTPVSEMLLGIKANVTLEHHDQAEAVPNPYYLGMGAVVNQRFKQLQLSKAHAIDNQGAILQALRPSDTAYFAPATNIKNQWTTQKQATTYHFLHTVTLTAAADGPLYYEDLSGDTKYTTFRVNDALVAPSIDANERRLLLNLGTFKKGQTVKLTFKTRHTTLKPNIQLASLDIAQFNQVYQQLLPSSWLPRYQANGFATQVTGTINNQSANRWLFVSIPYEPTWQATVNGHQVMTKPALQGLTLVKVGHGKQTVTLRYRVPGLRLGATIAILSFLSYLGLGWFYRH